MTCGSQHNIFKRKIFEDITNFIIAPQIDVTLILGMYQLLKKT
jgi:hypothetical protein